MDAAAPFYHYYGIIPNDCSKALESIEMYLTGFMLMTGKSVLHYYFDCLCKSRYISLTTFAESVMIYQLVLRDFSNETAPEKLRS